MEQQNTHPDTLWLYGLSNGKPVISLTTFPSPADEYRAAFEDRTQPFLYYYSIEKGKVEKRTLTRGEFWDLACRAAACLKSQGTSKGDRVVHAFSCNSLYDLVFRLAGILVGSIPVTINWQVDNIERIAYKTRVTEAKLVIYDKGFAEKVEAIKTNLPGLRLLEVNEIKGEQSAASAICPALDWDDERIVIFTSGTTGKPKGVSLSHRSYLTNRLTYDQYFGVSETTRLDLLLVNPLHHTNSTALSDWGMRRKGARIHLVQRYSTLFWKILVDVVSEKRDLLVTSLVSRHIDFLDSLVVQGKLPVEEEKLKNAMSHTDILIGSAPVGPKTIERIRKFSGRTPHVRFGSTETCLQVTAIPVNMSDDETMKAFRAGWNHRYKGEEAVGYYIGREHFPFTRLKVVRSIDPENSDYMKPCEIGEPGYLLTQGGNIMSGYVGDAKATEEVFREGWYNGFRDIVFTLKNDDGHLDYYWMSRDSELLIRGGANYAYAQVEAELSKIVVENFHLKPEDFQLAVVGLRLESEHEDSCCVTIELRGDAISSESRLKSRFLETARQAVSTGAKPDLVRFAPIPRNFKGVVLYPQLKQEVLNWLQYDK